MKLKKYWPLISLIVLITPVALALGEGLVPCGRMVDGVVQSPCTLCHLVALFQNLLNLFIKVIIVYVALFSIMYAGFLIITEKNKKLGYEIIQKTLVGIVVILLAWTIVNTILYIVGPDAKDENDKPLSKTWNRINCD